MIEWNMALQELRQIVLFGKRNVSLHSRIEGSQMPAL